jgi:tRNA (guanine-N7-)-methyltransferase
MNQVDTSFYYRLLYEPEANATRLAYDHSRMPDSKIFEKYWKDRRIPQLSPQLFSSYPKAWLEIGAGSGTFATSLGKLYPDSLGIALERSRMRGKRLEKRVERLGTDNVVGLRGNVIPTFIRDVPESSLDRIYCLYPCPWPKNSQRKNRWYLHPIMPHIVRALKPGGLILWASDQQFYIDEARWVSEEIYKLKTLEHGPLKPNAYNDFDKFPNGRSTFESGFLARGHTCHELVSQLAK